MFDTCLHKCYQDSYSPIVISTTEFLSITNDIRF